MQLSIVLISFNCSRLLDRCLASVLESSFLPPLEIIVVDNQSSDNTREMLREKYPSVRCVFNKENAGFAAAANQGAGMASGENLFFLNPDAVLRKETIHRLISALKNNSCGAVGPKLTDADGRIQYVCARRLPSFLGVFFNLFLLERLFPKSRVFGRNLMGDWDHHNSRQVECVSGAAMMVKKGLFEKIGGFDQDYLFYSEDIDLCKKIQKAGEKIFYCAEAEVVHAGGGSTGRGGPRSKFYEIILFYSNRLYFSKHASPVVCGAFNLMAALAALIRMALILLIGPFYQYKENSNFSFSTLKKYKEIFLLSTGLKNFTSYETAFKNTGNF